MDLVPVVLTLLAVVVTVIGIAFPLIRARGTDDGTASPDELSDLGRMREARNEALTAIMDLDDELDRGNVSEGEHRVTRVLLVRRAAALIREIEGREHILDEEIERVVGLRRERMRGEDQLASSEQSDTEAESAP